MSLADVSLAGLNHGPLYLRLSTSVSSPLLLTLDDLHRSSCFDEIEKLDNIAVSHTDAANGAGYAHFDAVRAAVNVDVAPHGIDIAEPVETWLTARQPQNAREHPVAARKLRTEIIAIALASWTSPHKNCIHGKSTSDLGANNMPPAGRTKTAIALAGAVLGRRHRIAAQRRSSAVGQFEALFGDIDTD